MNRPRKDGINGKNRNCQRLRFGTLNILTMTNKLDELVDVMKKRRLDLMGLSETKWAGHGEKELRDGYKLFWSGRRRGRNGVAFVGNKEMKDMIEEVKFISDRIIKVRLRRMGENIEVIQVYAPQTGCAEQEKLDFEGKLEEHMERVNIVMGDLNAKVGKDRRGYEDVLGAFGYGPRNKEGERLLDLCVRNDMAIGNSRFQKRESHVVTRYNWDGSQKSVIDYIMVDRMWGQRLVDVKVIPSVNMDGDHRLLVGTFKCLGRVRKIKEEIKRIKNWKLQSKGIAEEFRELIREKIPRGEVENVETEWEKFQKTLVEAAVKSCGRTTGKRRNKTSDWWNEKTVDAVREKNRAFRKWWKSRSQVDRLEYNVRKRECDRIVREEKQKSWENFTKKLGEDMEGNKKMLFKMMKNKKRVTEVVRAMEDENGRVLEREESIKELWKNHFEKLLNYGLQDQDRAEDGDGGSLEEIEEITWSELENAVKGMKNNKSAGPDEVTSDMIKALGPMGIQWLKRLFGCILREKRTPEEWGRGDIITLFKKGNRKRCKNYRGITLMSQVAKIFEKVIFGRIRDYIEGQLSEEQHGFRKNRSTIDLIFATRQLIEKHWEYDKQLILVFIDIEKAYDSVKREVIWDSMRRIGVTECYIEWIKELYRIHKCRVRTDVGYTEWFDIGKGLKQGSILSPVLFNVVMEVMLREVKNAVGNVNAMLFADDIMLWGRDAEELQRQLDVWSELMKERGLRINGEKSEVMVVGRNKELENPLTVEGDPLKLVEQFVYLGTVLSEDGKMSQEITARLGKGSGFYHSVKHLVWDRKVPLTAKMTLYKTYYRPIVTYGAETWNVQEKEWSRIQAGEMRFLRSIMGKSRWDRVRNEEIRGGLEEDSLRGRVEKMRLRWFGHVRRMHGERIPKKMELMAIQGRRPRGRPRRRWIESVKRDVERRGVSWQRVEEEKLWEDRARWRGLVNTQTRE